jgi:hypothetical protein
VKKTDADAYAMALFLSMFVWCFADRYFFLSLLRSTTTTSIFHSPFLAHIHTSSWFRCLFFVVFYRLYKITIILVFFCASCQSGNKFEGGDVIDESVGSKLTR